MYSKEFELLQTKFPELVLKNSYAVLFDLRTLFRPIKHKDGLWTRICTKGQFELSDYDCGVLYVELGVLPYTLEKNNIEYIARFHVGCADDGQWDAESKVFNNEQEAINLVEKIAPLLDDLHTLPCERDLNELLHPYGMYGVFN